MLPQLNTNKDQLEKLIENGKDQLGKKGIEINLFKETHNIRIKGSDDKDSVKEAVKESSNKSQNVLVV